MTDQEKIKDSIEEYFMRLYTDPLPDRPKLVGIEFDRISEDQQRWLERPFLEEEVKLALNSMKDDKGPGPDGFPTKFLQVCWDVVGGKAMVALELST